jgi:hypothetical protein
VSDCLCCQAGRVHGFRSRRDGVEDDEELADAGGEGLFGGFSGGSQLLVKGVDDGIGAGSGQCGHVKRGPHRGAPAGDGFSAAPNAAVAIDGGDADEGGDFSPIEAPELRQFGDQGAQGRLAYSRRAGEGIGVGLPGGAVSEMRACEVAASGFPKESRR